MLLDKKVPPRPEQILEDIFQQNDDYTTIKGLRHPENMDYILFLENFIQCGIGVRSWKYKSNNKLLSDYVTDSIEAFLVVVYESSYKQWMNRFGPINGVEISENNNDEVSDLSTSTGSLSNKYKFFGDTYDGNRSKGMKEIEISTYNQVIKIIREQKKIYGEKYEMDFREKMKNSDKTTRIRKRRNITTASNDLNKLIKLVDNN